MDILDDLLKVPEPFKSDQLTGSILDSTTLLGTNLWRQASNDFDLFAEPEAVAGLSLEQQQYLSDLRVDRFLHQTLAHEFELLDLWLERNQDHPEAARVALFLRHRQRLGQKSWIDDQEKLYLWAQKHEREDLAVSILGWRLLCQDLAESLLAWSSRNPDDPRVQQIRLWQESPGFYPQNRLRTWAIRFPEDARAPQILAWEELTTREIMASHPELLTETGKE
ncbi:MAG: hypothetical protein JO279_00745 [Verrucomicrobia bacterium]|nr:hypothetical protein [Verrucomicrobiota bacterium]MBV8375509.1 hypothetical protein [Verrucomicrobiota bacterium]